MTLIASNKPENRPAAPSHRSNDKVAKDLNILGDFVSIFCRERHKADIREPILFKDERLVRVLEKKKLVLCQDCTRLLQHATTKLLHCPQDPKPMCKKCPIHCYAPWYRERIREVMKFSGLYLIKHGRIDLLLHYLS